MRLLTELLRLLTELSALFVVSCLFAFAGLLVAGLVGDLPGDATRWLAVAVSASATWAASRPLGLWQRSWIVKLIVVAMAILVPFFGGLYLMMMF